MSKFFFCAPSFFLMVADIFGFVFNFRNSSTCESDELKNYEKLIISFTFAVKVRKGRYKNSFSLNFSRLK